jgi:hypothetical protein
MRDGTLEFKKPRIQEFKKPIQESGVKNLPPAKKLDTRLASTAEQSRIPYRAVPTPPADS